MLCFTDCSHSNGGTSFFVGEENKKASFELSSTVVLRVTITDEAPVATACISSGCASENKNLNNIFLFGGFELITNVNTLQVFVTRDKGDEEYLTSCKGIPARDLPPLVNDQTSEIKDLNVNGWFKFVLASPGGAKPVYRVRLEFNPPSSKEQNIISSVIVRTLKTKCRLMDTESQTSNHSPHANNIYALRTEQTAGMGIMHDSVSSVMAMMQKTRTMPNAAISQQKAQSMTTDEPTADNRNMNNLSALMAMMSNTHINTASKPPINPLQQALHKSEKNHAEMMSSIAGLGMFLKTSEEKTMKSLETMLSQMESRISTKLHDLSQRLDDIEQHISCTEMSSEGDSRE